MFGVLSFRGVKTFGAGQYGCRKLGMDHLRRETRQWAIVWLDAIMFVQQIWAWKQWRTIMPNYPFRCEKGHDFEVFGHMANPPTNRSLPPLPRPRSSGIQPSSGGSSLSGTVQ